MSLALKKQQFIVDKSGQPKSVVLDLVEYNRLLKFVEDLEDSLDLKHAVETNTGFTSHNELLSHLRKQNLL